MLGGVWGEAGRWYKVKSGAWGPELGGGKRSRWETQDPINLPQRSQGFQFDKFFTGPLSRTAAVALGEQTITVAPADL